MPCSICHQKGHNKKTHYKLYPIDTIESKEVKNAKKGPESIKAKLKDDIESQCCICMENINKKNNYCITKCGHEFCLECMANNINHNNNACPLCRTELVERRKPPFKMSAVMVDSLISSSLNNAMSEYRNIIFNNRKKYNKKILKELNKELTKELNTEMTNELPLNYTNLQKNLINITKNIMSNKLYYNEEKIREEVMMCNIFNNLKLIKTCSILYENTDTENYVSEDLGDLVEMVEQNM